MFPKQSFPPFPKPSPKEPPSPAAPTSLNPATTTPTAAAPTAAPRSTWIFNSQLSIFNSQGWKERRMQNPPSSCPVPGQAVQAASRSLPNRTASLQLASSGDRRGCPSLPQSPIFNFQSPPALYAKESSGLTTPIPLAPIETCR